MPDDKSLWRLKSKAVVILDQFQPIFLGTLYDILKSWNSPVKGKPFIAIEAALGSGVLYISEEESKKRRAYEISDRIERKEKEKNKAKERFIDKYGSFHEFDGEFKPGETLDFEYYEPTDYVKIDDSGTYRAFRFLKDTNHDGAANDYFIIREITKGEHAGKKEKERVPEEDLF